MPNTSLELIGRRSLLVHQKHELGELFGFETRNKYEILDENQTPVAFAAEQHKGVFGFLLRQFLGHWRTFEIHFFSSDRKPVMIARHPFRIFFQRLEVFDVSGRSLGAIQQRFSIFTKRFDVQNPLGQVLMEVSSPFWRLWTFPFTRQGREIAAVKKKWSGALFELFTDKDKFLVEYQDPSLSEVDRRLILAASLFIDLQYFEAKAD